MTESREKMEKLISQLTAGEPESIVDAVPAACDSHLDRLKARPAPFSLQTAGRTS